MTPQLKADFWVKALIRRAQSQKAFAAILRKGDPDAGIVLIVLRNRQNLKLYLPERDFDGNRVWRLQNMADQTELDGHINRRLDEDPDIWLVEIESDGNPQIIIGEKIIDEAQPPDPAQLAAQALFRVK